MTKFLLDSGNPQEYKQINEIAAKYQEELWGSTTNPSLIAKTLSGKKVTQAEAFSVLQKQIVSDILRLVPGPVSAEVYATSTTSASEMIAQGKEIATWNPRVVVKLPTTIEGFKARTELRKQGICINNTLVFSQEQSFAILLHEKLMIREYGKPTTEWPCFISPFVGRLDDIGIDGMSLVSNCMTTSQKFFEKDTCWMLEASVRSITHMQRGINMQVELITAPAKVYAEWFGLSEEQKGSQITLNTQLAQIPYWEPSEELINIATLEEFMNAITSPTVNIQHELTDKGIEKFAADWSTIIE